MHELEKFFLILSLCGSIFCLVLCSNFFLWDATSFQRQCCRVPEMQVFLSPRRAEYRLHVGMLFFQLTCLHVGMLFFWSVSFFYVRRKIWTLSYNKNKENFENELAELPWLLAILLFDSIKCGLISNKGVSTCLGGFHKKEKSSCICVCALGALFRCSFVLPKEAFFFRGVSRDNKQTRHWLRVLRTFAVESPEFFGDFFRFPSIGNTYDVLRKYKIGMI